MPNRFGERLSAPYHVIHTLKMLAGAAGAPVDRVIRALLDEYEKRLPPDVRRRVEREYQRLRSRTIIH